MSVLAANDTQAANAIKAVLEQQLGDVALSVGSPQTGVFDAAAHLPGADALVHAALMQAVAEGALSLALSAATVARIAEAGADPAQVMNAAINAAVPALEQASGQSVNAMAPNAIDASSISGRESVIVPISDADGVIAHVIVQGRLDDSGVAPHEFQPLIDSDANNLNVGNRSLDILHEVELDVTAELGRLRMMVREVLAITPGTVLELDRPAGSPIDVLVNGVLIARGEVVVIDEEFGVRITEILTGQDDIVG
jgi:flagellar motor switch protein FliN/FliY